MCCPLGLCFGVACGPGIGARTPAEESGSRRQFCRKRSFHCSRPLGGGAVPRGLAVVLIRSVFWCWKAGLAPLWAAPQGPPSAFGGSKDPPPPLRARRPSPVGGTAGPRAARLPTRSTCAAALTATSTAAMALRVDRIIPSPIPRKARAQWPHPPAQKGRLLGRLGCVAPDPEFIFDNLGAGYDPK